MNTQQHTSLWCLEDVDLVASLSQTQQQALLAFLKTQDYHKGETVFLPGTASEMVYFLHEGLIKIYRTAESGKRLTLDLICRKGAPFGLMALTGQEKHDLTAQAVIDSRLCAIYKEDLLCFANANPVIRLAKLLLKLAHDFGKEFKMGRRIEIRFTHQELADLIGASREQVTMTPNRFIKEKILKKSQKRIIIKNEEGLRMLANARREPA